MSNPRLEELAQLHRKALEGGGPERIALQHEKGKLTARERLALLLDEGTFNELEPFVILREDAGTGRMERYPGDGVVTGYGQIDGRTLYFYAQDFTVYGGTLSEMHAQKICRVMDLALRNGTPFVGLIDSGGARIQEGVVLIVGVLVPPALPLVAMLMVGNLFRESGVVERLSRAAQNEIINIATIFLGFAIGSTMVASSFLSVQTLGILLLGLLAFVLGTGAGLVFGKIMCVLSGRRINPLVGAAGISAFPMSGRLAQRVAQEEDFSNFILMHALGANTAGQLGSVIAGGVLLAMFGVS